MYLIHLFLIRKYKKRFNSEILCAALWGVNLLIGTENGLMLLDRSGQGKLFLCVALWGVNLLIGTEYGLMLLDRLGQGNYSYALHCGA